jgi:hypothetical protein
LAEHIHEGFPSEEFQGFQLFTFDVTISSKILSSRLLGLQSIFIGYLVPYWLSSPALGFWIPSRFSTTDFLHHIFAMEYPLLPLVRVQSLSWPLCLFPNISFILANEFDFLL